MGVAKTILFLYGSLKRGHINHRQMAGQEYLGEVVTEPRYRVLDLGKYPGLIRDDVAGLAVRGELWAVSADHLPGLDAFEGGEGLYARSPVAVVGQSGVETYFWLGEVPEGVRSGSEWPLPAGV
ncbi:MAG: gamma-glutamylcyclotransferase [Gemmataceae bacterium]|nr:gamma-glutamylcyclotransferase [Gemmataceae bacterium]